MVENIGEINVPAGTIIEWNIQTKNVNRLIINPSNDTLSPIDNNTQVRRRFLKSSRLNITSQNNLIKKGDSINFSIRVSPDLYPSIEVNLQKDSLSQKILYFMGSISDDHGFDKLQFHYTHLRDEKYLISDSNNIEIPINLSQINQKFYHLWNLDAIEAQPDDKIEYYFKVWDNDEVNGSKYTQTPIANYKIPSLKEIEKLTEKLNQEIKESLNDAQSKSKNLEEQIKSVEKMLTEKKNLDWNDKRKIQELLEKKKSISFWVLSSSTSFMIFSSFFCFSRSSS